MKELRFKNTMSAIDLIESSDEFKQEVFKIIDLYGTIAIFNIAGDLKKYVYKILNPETQNTYPIIGEYVLRGLDVVDWEKAAKYFVKKYEKEKQS